MMEWIKWIDPPFFILGLILGFLFVRATQGRG